MNVELDDFKNGWYGLSLSIQVDEIDTLIDMLSKLKKDKTQHFHIRSDYTGNGGVGDIELSVQGEEQKSNMSISSGFAITPNR